MSAVSTSCARQHVVCQRDGRGFSDVSEAAGRHDGALGLGFAVRRPQQRRLGRSRRGERIHHARTTRAICEVSIGGRSCRNHPWTWRRPPSGVIRYRQGWKALNRLLHEDRSFSGRERNCAFLNLGGQQFASVASVTGLDFPDDGRAVAVVDWDFDGQLDLWTTAHTSPRLRFLHNQIAHGGHFVAIKLQGNGLTTNRDAIGARVELYVRDDATPKRVKTLHAGDGFLSQSSYWMHFGLGQNLAIDRLVVRWPGGDIQQFDSLDADAFYHIEQGQTEARRWQPPQERLPIRATAPALPNPESSARIVLATRLPVPALTVWQDADQTQPLDELHRGGPVLINLWSSTCQPCLRELSDWSQQADAFRQRGLQVVALNTDQIEDGQPSPVAAELMASLRWPFAWHFATVQTVKNLDFFQRAMLDHWTPLPVPCSFLLDQNSQVAVIYKGPTQIDQILADVALLGLPPSGLRQAAIPFPGRWLHAVPSPDPLPVTLQMIDHAQVSEGIRYLQDYATFVASSASHRDQLASLGDVYYILAVLLEDQGHVDEAILAYQQSSRRSPDSFRVHESLGRLLGSLKRFDAAVPELQLALDINSNDVDTRRRLAMALAASGQPLDAIVQFRQVLAQREDDAVAHFELANAVAQDGSAGSRDWPLPAGAAAAADHVGGRQQSRLGAGDVIARLGPQWDASGLAGRANMRSHALFASVSAEYSGGGLRGIG